MATVDPYDRFVSLKPTYVERLRELRVLDDIASDYVSASWVAAAIINAIAERGYHDRATAIALRQKAANVAARSSLGIYWWHDPVAVSNALAKAADALDESCAADAVPKTGRKGRAKVKAADSASPADDAPSTESVSPADQWQPVDWWTNPPK